MHHNHQHAYVSHQPTEEVRDEITCLWDGGRGVGEGRGNEWCIVMVINKLQALVYDILPSTTAIFSYAIGPRLLKQ